MIGKFLNLRIEIVNHDTEVVIKKSKIPAIGEYYIKQYIKGQEHVDKVNRNLKEIKNFSEFKKHMHMLAKL